MKNEQLEFDFMLEKVAKEYKMNAIEKAFAVQHDPVETPKHYLSHPSRVECITITEHMSFNLGNVFKYCWRTDHKNGIQDLEKALWYLKREIALRKKNNNE